MVDGLRPQQGKAKTGAILLSAAVVCLRMLAICAALAQAKIAHPHARVGWEIASGFPLPVSREEFAPTPPEKLAAIYGISLGSGPLTTSEQHAGPALRLTRPALFGDPAQAEFYGKPRPLGSGVCAIPTKRVQLYDVFVFPLGWRLVSARRAEPEGYFTAPLTPIGANRALAEGAWSCGSLAGRYAFRSLGAETDADASRQAALAQLLLGPTETRQTDFELNIPGGTCSIGGSVCNADNFFRAMDVRWVTQVSALPPRQLPGRLNETVFQDDFCFHKPGPFALPLRDFCMTVSSHRDPSAELHIVAVS